MLVEKVKDNDIKTIKLITGEEIICVVKQKNDATITITNPLMFTISKTTTEGLNEVIFVPWLISVDRNKDIEFSTSKIILIADSSEISKEKYNEALFSKN